MQVNDGINGLWGQDGAGLEWDSDETLKVSGSSGGGDDGDGGSGGLQDIRRLIHAVFACVGKGSFIIGIVCLHHASHITHHTSCTTRQSSRLRRP